MRDGLRYLSRNGTVVRMHGNGKSDGLDGGIRASWAGKQVARLNGDFDFLIGFPRLSVDSKFYGFNSNVITTFDLIVLLTRNHNIFVAFRTPYFKFRTIENNPLQFFHRRQTPFNCPLQIQIRRLPHPLHKLQKRPVQCHTRGMHSNTPPRIILHISFIFPSVSIKTAAGGSGRGHQACSRALF
jgi:hypothetical protein